MIGKVEINRSLRTASFTEATRLVRTIAFEVERHFDACRSSADDKGNCSNASVVGHARSIAAQQEVLGATGGSRSVTLQQVCDRYLSDPTNGRTPKSLLAYRTTYSTILAILGAETQITSITRDACRDLLGVLQRLPPNARKRWPNLMPRAAAAKAMSEHTPPMSPANANEYMNKLSTLLNWAVKEEVLGRNPAKGLRITEAVAPRDKRKPFSGLQLRRIFNSPLYRGCRDDELGFAIVGTARPRRSRFWIPLIALYTGMRQNEICQLYTRDVREIEGVWCFVVTAGGAGDKRLKTAASERLVPIHPVLVRIGFLDYLAERRRAGDVRLFPELRPDGFGLYSGMFSKWFTRFLASCDAAEERTCFHSFRHSFRDGLREAGADREIALAIGGWSGAGTSAVADLYGKGYSPKVLHATLATIDYPELDLAHLFGE